MDKDAKIYVAGHRGLVGSAIVRRLHAEGYDNLLVKTSKELDLRDQAACARFFTEERPEYVFLAAAKVGGILANNSYPAEFIYDNVMIQSNVIHNAYKSGVRRLLFLGSTCIYPRLAPQPLKEECLLTGPLEPTNEPYAIAKIAGITMCRSYNRQYGTSFLAAMPTNLYGPNDNFDLESSHVLPALIRKFHEVRMFQSRCETIDERINVSSHPSDTPREDKVVIWGTGEPKREFLHVDDLADASLFLMNLPDGQYKQLVTNNEAPALLNIGSGEEVSIRELALLIKKVVGFSGELFFDHSKPDGTPRKLSDVTRINSLGWRHRIDLEDGLRKTYLWYVKNLESRL
jgi:GDP-L-fucose synthase